MSLGLLVSEVTKQLWAVKLATDALLDPVIQKKEFERSGLSLAWKREFLNYRV